MKRKKPAGILVTAILILTFSLAACALRDTRAGTTSAPAVSTNTHSTKSETSASASQTGENTQPGTSAVSGVTETTGISATTRAQPATTAPVQTTSTTSPPVTYAEWTYRNRTGGTVTYSENPENPYIRLVSRQTGIPPDRLSTSFWSQGAAVFVFRSADRNTDTLENAYFVLSKDMEIFTVSGEQAEAQYSKFSRETAVALYAMALEHRP